MDINSDKDRVRDVVCGKEMERVEVSNKSIELIPEWYTADVRYG